jgi:hypothetical protein
VYQSESLYAPQKLIFKDNGELEKEINVKNKERTISKNAET